jgi:hypothetical protein
MKLPHSLLVLAFVAAPAGAQSACFDWAGDFAAYGIDAPTAFTAVNALLVWDDGGGAGQRLFAGGTFTSIGGVAAANVAAWDGTGWTPVGAGVNGFPGYLPFMGGVPTHVAALCLHDAGSGVEMYAGGAWTSAGGQACRGVARWNGTHWIGMPGIEASVASMASYDDGSGPALYVSGYMYLPTTGAEPTLMRWRNGAWEIPPTNGVGIGIALCVFDDGSGSKLYAGGSGVAGSPGIIRWDGTSWSGVGGGVGPSSPFTMLVHDDGNGAALYAAGAFTQAGGAPAARIARWDGTSWSALGAGFGNGQVNDLATYPDPFGGPAKLVAVGTFTIAGGAPANRVAAWDGTSWAPLGSGVSGSRASTVVAFDDQVGSGRDLYVGGALTSAGDHPVSSFAKWEGCGGTGIPFCFGDGTLASACPCANAGADGHGCASSQVAAGGLLSASGVANPDTVVLGASDLPPGVSSIFLQGDGMIATGVVFGDGLRCAGGNLVRLALKSAIGGAASFPEAGDPSITARSAALGAPIAPSSSRFYQVYYRDNDVLFCAAPAGATWNVTNGIRIHW